MFGIGEDGADDDRRPRVGRRPATSRRELEDIAFDLFADRGFDRTSVDDIAAAAGIGRRTFFRYYPSKNDLVWGDFETQLDGMRARISAAPEELPMMEAVQRAVIDFNRLTPDQEPQHRQRLGLILGVPTLLANSTLRFAQWRAVISGFAAGRLGLDADDLVPQVIGHSALGASIAAYEDWLRHDDADLSALLERAFAELATGFRHPAR
jgi:mycofactocin system transcriptional regulator